MRFKSHIRLQVFNKFAGKCAYCGNPLNLLHFQIDHINPHIKSNSLLNLYPCCSRCNILKSHRTPDEWKIQIKSKLYVLQHENPFTCFLTSLNQVSYSNFEIQFYFEKHANSN